MRRGFTLTELMIVITIMTIMGGLGAAAFTAATNMAREHRTQAMIRKIDGLIMERWEGYRTRSLAVRIPPNVDSRTSARIRLSAMRDLQRMELPDRISDAVSGPQNVAFNQQYQNGQMLPAVVMAQPSLQRSYQRRLTSMLGVNWSAKWTTAQQGAECLYLILSTIRDGDKSALDYFDAIEIGDTDGDGVPEILDGWGTPIEFLRWPAGYVSMPGAEIDSMQVADRVVAPDVFDPARVDPRWAQPTAVPPYLIHPLIYSAGRDRKYDINSEGGLSYVNVMPIPNDPYYSNNGRYVGTPTDSDQDGALSYFDNITNHKRN